MKEGMTYKRLGDLATYVNGYAFKPETWSEVGIPIIRIQNLNNPDADYNYYNGELPSKFVVERGDLLISWSASLGVYIWEGGKAYLNQHIFKVVFGKSDILKGYLRYAVEAQLADMKRKSHGGTMKHIVKGDFDNIKIPVPSVSFQEQVVRELDSLSSIIADKRLQLAELDNLVQAVFLDTFGDPLSNPKNWAVRKMEEVAPCRKYEGEIKPVDGLYWLLNLDMVESNSGTVLGKVMQPKKEVGNSTTTFSPANVLYSKLRPYLNKVVLPDDYGYCTTELIPLLPNPDLLTREYLVYLLRGASFVNYINEKVAGAKMPRVKMGDFWKFNVPLPPVVLQQEFADKVRVIDEQKALIEQSIKEFENLLAQRMEFHFA